MSRGLFTLTSGMLTQQYKVNIYSNNLANMNTAGYKREQPVTSTFGELYLSRLRQDGIVENAVGIGPTNLIRITEDNNTIHSQGVFDETNGAFDFAIVGAGFFAVDNGNNTLYTRNGSFMLDQEGYLIFSNKGRVQGENGDIYIGTDKYTFTEDGNIYVDGEQIDRLLIYDFDDYNNIDKADEGMYTANVQANIVENPTILKGSIERSNVDLTEEMTQIMASQRALQNNGQALKIYDLVMDMASNQIGKVQ